MVSAFAFCNALKAGASDPTLRVFGGRNADPFEYPYVVRMEIQGKVKLQDSYKGLSIHVCTASVLSLVWTLTAGHCIDGADYMIAHHLLESELISLVIRYGSTDNSFSAVIATVKHPTYKFINIKTSQLLRNDVGLLKTMPIKLDWYGKLSAMEYPSLMGQASVAVGYGLTKAGNQVDTTLKLGQPLQVLDVLIQKCPKIDLTYTYPNVCISRQCKQQIPTTLCPGDSGGPLIHYSGIVAVNTATFIKCNLRVDNLAVTDSRVAGVLTPVGPFIGWITHHITKDKTTILLSHFNIVFDYCVLSINTFERK